MLTLVAGQAESLWDEALPTEVRELPEDLAALDRVLSDPGWRRWRSGSSGSWRPGGRWCWMGGRR